MEELPYHLHSNLKREINENICIHYLDIVC